MSSDIVNKEHERNEQQQEIQGTFSKVQFIQKLIKQYYSEKDSCKYNTYNIYSENSA